MIRRIQARRYRCFPQLDLPLRDFQILVGPNGSGKSSLFGAIRFLGAFIQRGLAAGVTETTSNGLDLKWLQQEGPFQLSVDIGAIPTMSDQAWVSYAVECNVSSSGQVTIVRESVDMFAAEDDSLNLVTRTGDGTARYGARESDGAALTQLLNPDESALFRLPREALGPALLWIRHVLAVGLFAVQLESSTLRGASSPVRRWSNTLTGSELPWDVQDLRERDPQAFRAWQAHLKVFLPHIREIRTSIREDDRHAYVRAEEESGISVPAWTLSDGTLRLLALTNLAYGSTNGKLYLIEEPENGLHPGALEAVYQSLRSVYGGQVLVTTHSPVLISIAEPEDLLCFSRAESGAVTVIPGDQHPILRNWKRSVSLGELFAAGVLQ